MTYTTEEKTLILGALFHDIGKFEQRCTKNPDKKKHQVLGVEFVNKGNLYHHFIKIIGEDGFNSLQNIIGEHHSRSTNELTNVVQEADHLSASERVEKEDSADAGVYNTWSNKHLSSVFSKIRLLSEQSVEPRYFSQELLIKDRKNYEIIIPKDLSKQDITGGQYAYTSDTFGNFTEDIASVLSFSNDEEDFCNIVNLLLMVYEKYLWCIPDFTGSPETDISLYNHLKDVAGISQAIFRTKKENPGSTKLNLIIGDIPGIQGYIFDIINTKPAKMLRGRSIFVQVLTRMLATKFINGLGLSECSLIMQAGGKFYILAPHTEETERLFDEIYAEIEDHLFEQFGMDLGFNSAMHIFDYQELKDHKITFGQVIEDVTFKLNKNKHKLFSRRLFPNGADESKFIWKEEYIEVGEDLSDSIKCKVTDRPIRDKHRGKIRVPDGDKMVELDVTDQVETEFKIGEKITGDNVVIPLNTNGLFIIADKIERVKEFVKRNHEFKNKILLNPDLDELLSLSQSGSSILKNTYYLQVASYCSAGEDNEILSFEELSKNNLGAEYLTLIKGDIDNLGLIMAYGLQRSAGGDIKDMTAISRTTTMSNHLKYFFSFFLNGFLGDREGSLKDNKVYTIFAGGDDLMLVTPQSSAVKLINDFEAKFKDFACGNPEVHISYSVTHFKDHTPIRLVADMAEENQKAVKQVNKDIQRRLVDEGNKAAFSHVHDKSSLLIYNTSFKTDQIPLFLSHINSLVKWIKDDKVISHGMIRKLLDATESMTKYELTKDAGYLLWVARLTYAVNRLLNDVYDRDKRKEAKEFFNKVLSFRKDEERELKEMLYPIVCQVIYNLR